MKHIALFSFLTLFIFSACWKDKSPENLPRLKEDFKSQVAKFEKKKDSANSKVKDGLESLNGLQEALQDTKNEDKEFAKVYGDWEKVNKRVEKLFKEFEDLKDKASQLFKAMEDQSNSLNDQKNKNDLLAAISKARKKYSVTLITTSKAIDKLKLLHTDALDVVKALEVAVALNSFDDINAQMKSIEGRVDDIMADLNVAVVESKKLYEKKLDELN